MLGILTLAASTLVSVYATLIFRLHLPGDAPRVVWKYFAIGFWLWTLGEFFWLVQSLAGGQISGMASELRIAHFFWFTGYIFFSMALYAQHKIVAARGRQHRVWIVFAFWAAIAAFALIALLGMGETLSTLNFLQHFVGFADLAVGLIALSMLMKFRGGALAWPWWGFVGLAVSNIVFVALDATMMASVSENVKFVLELLSELTYVAAYVVLSLGFYKYYALLRYGPRVDIATRSQAQPQTR